ncbi:hypothetical protein H632_c494p1 [Helicosporidium sp. ATCC 50920]|nr:hypothetical protein H632_c494p1 [Helicosporidium sp. ATCC 50920]|eukprot:KDD75799.1 hypothetical protein H632_c494p1 [Helicosporidium sp. ATCC 50920]
MTSHPPPFRARLKSAEVQPSASEQALFDLLLEAADTVEPRPTLRAAGGWVRDALLGTASPDIDIALERSTGEAFALALAAHVAAKGGGPAPSVVVIEANPEQSKHLATARTKVLGQWLDLVNLRSEEYASGSRIPVVREGTPLQDALRRDFTVNALFYNLHSRSVEDFTGRGLADLRRGLIKTPLPPKETFLDDPLRVLRALRFGARLGFDLDDDLLVAAADEEVRFGMT